MNDKGYSYYHEFISKGIALNLFRYSDMNIYTYCFISCLPNYSLAIIHSNSLLSYKIALYESTIYRIKIEDIIDKLDSKTQEYFLFNLDLF